MDFYSNQGNMTMVTDNVIVKTRVKYDPVWEEWSVWPYNAAGQLIEAAIYYANDKQDAYDTAPVMIKLSTQMVHGRRLKMGGK